MIITRARYRRLFFRVHWLLENAQIRLHCVGAGLLLAGATQLVHERKLQRNARKIRLSTVVLSLPHRLNSESIRRSLVRTEDVMQSESHLERLDWVRDVGEC